MIKATPRILCTFKSLLLSIWLPFQARDLGSQFIVLGTEQDCCVSTCMLFMERGVLLREFRQLEPAALAIWSEEEL